MLRRRYVAACLSLLGLLSLSYLLGAAAIFFDLPSSPFLRRAFVGGLTWYEHKANAVSLQQPDAPLRVSKTDTLHKACEGFTLCLYGSDTHARLLDMQGKIVHDWHVSFSQLWPTPPHLYGRVDDTQVNFSDAYLYPNGDLLGVLEGPVNLHNSSHGYGLVKLDKDSHVLWKYAEKCHHDLDVAEDGTIYALVNEVVDQVPSALSYIPTPCLVDFVDVLSPEGQRLKRIPLLEAFLDSPYSALLCSLERSRIGGGTTTTGGRLPLFVDEERRRDVLHTNAVKVLSKKLAPKFPLFKAGQLLISLRRLDAIAVLDTDSGKIVWAARGPWRAQHDPRFLENGHLLLYDNLGSPLASRVLEYEPKTQAFPWSYPGDKGKALVSKVRGVSQRLPNGNTLIVDSDGGEVLEVAPNCEVVWSCACGLGELYRAIRYTAEQLPFLKGDMYARP